MDATYERTYYHNDNMVLTRRTTRPTTQAPKLPVFTPPRREGLRFTRPKNILHDGLCINAAIHEHDTQWKSAPPLTSLHELAMVMGRHSRQAVYY